MTNTMDLFIAVNLYDIKEDTPNHPLQASVILWSRVCVCIYFGMVYEKGRTMVATHVSIAWPLAS